MTRLSLPQSAEQTRLLVLGDLILDRYTWANADRVSPEAPVLVLDAKTQEVRLGGAASVARLAQSLNARVCMAGVAGDDHRGRILQTLLDQARIDRGLVVCDPERPTTCKERFMGRAAGRHPHQIVRVDHETRRPLHIDLERKLATEIESRMGQFQAVLISDYNKGVCTPTLLETVIAAARRRQLPVIVDPAKIQNYSRYRDANLLTPNRVEAELATGETVDSPEAALVAGRRLCESCGAEAVLVTLDSQGMALTFKERPGQIIPTRPRAVHDITGAGDMVLAVSGIGLAAGMPLADTVRLANLAAGMEVQRMGVSPISRAELEDESEAELRGNRAAVFEKLIELDRMIELAESYRRRGKTIVFTNGCFDLLHAGHASCLAEAAGLGDVLVVAVNSDRSLRRLKGPGRPIIPEQDRAALLAALGSVDHVLVFDADTPRELLLRIRPQILVKGGTCPIDEVVGREIVESQGGQVRMTAITGGVSTTQILNSILEDAKLRGGCGPQCCRNGPRMTLESAPPRR